MRTAKILALVALTFFLTQCSNEDTQENNSASKDSSNSDSQSSEPSKNATSDEILRTSLTEFQDGTVKEEYLVTAVVKNKPVRVFAVGKDDQILVAEGIVEESGKPIIINVYSKRGSILEWSSDEEGGEKSSTSVVGAQAPNGQLVNL